MIKGGKRIPAYATRCEQDPTTNIFSAQIWFPSEHYIWKNKQKKSNGNPYIYEVHIGMSSEKEHVASFTEFKETVLPRVAKLGYNAIQIMGLQVHQYYGSLG